MLRNMTGQPKQRTGSSWRGRMFHTTKYGPEDLLVMKTKVITVKGTKEGKVQTVKALAS